MWGWVKAGATRRDGGGSVTGHGSIAGMTGAAQQDIAEIPERCTIRVRDLVKVREQGGTVFQLEVPRLELAAGELVALVGESGCGKSTMLDLLGLILRPTRAAVFDLRDPRSGRCLDVLSLWATHDEDRLAQVRREWLGYVPQSGGLLPFLSVAANIALPSRLKTGDAGMSREIAGRMGIAGLLEKKPRYLSGGQRQRVAIARAMAHAPVVILADEPTAAVDRARARAIIADFRALARTQGCAILMVSHDLQLVDAFADRLYGYDVESLSPALTRSTCFPDHARI